MTAPAATISTARQARGGGPMMVLEPVSHPELEPIQIRDTLFAVGRGEAPFDAYPQELAADLSRRHARIFCEQGAVYLADLGSKNGTTVNGAPVRQGIVTLQSGDVVGLGRNLSYRVRLEHAALPQAASRLASLTLAPEQGGGELQPIVVSEFPFLVSKADGTFSRYKETSPAEVNYLSRRHAHIFSKGGGLWVEDLGSTNGTFLNGTRIGDKAVALHEGDVLAFGGRYFVYRVGMQWEAAARDPTLTQVGKAPAAAGADGDKTTFVAAADSFLDIFCAEAAPVRERAPEQEAQHAAGARQEAARRPPGRAEALLASLYAAAGGRGEPDPGRLRNWALAALALLVLLAWLLLRVGGTQREADELLSRGQYAQAARVANGALADDPGNGRLKAIGTEALLKAGLPAWMAALKAGRYRQAEQQVRAMREEARHNPELAALVDELDWITSLESFVAARGGALAPVRDQADAAAIQRFLRQWEAQGETHQRAFATISSHVPGFRDTYADAVSDIRKLALTRGAA